MTKKEQQIIAKIIYYIKHCRDKGFDPNNILDHLSNQYILNDIIKFGIEK